MQTVIETPAYLTSANDVGLSDEERDEIVGFLARHPDAGDLMPGTGGARKLRSLGAAKERAAVIGSSRFSRLMTSRFFCSTSMARARAQIFRKPSETSCVKC